MGKVRELNKKFWKAFVNDAVKQNDKNNYVKAQKQTAKDVKHNKAPDRCPSCLKPTQWKLVGNPKQGFSVGKAAAGALIAGPIGVAGGALGKKKNAYVCGNCGFQHVYDK